MFDRKICIILLVFYAIPAYANEYALGLSGSRFSRSGQVSILAGATDLVGDVFLSAQHLGSPLMLGDYVIPTENAQGNLAIKLNGKAGNVVWFINLNIGGKELRVALDSEGNSYYVGASGIKCAIQKINRTGDNSEVFYYNVGDVSCYFTDLVVGDGVLYVVGLASGVGVNGVDQVNSYGSDLVVGSIDLQGGANWIKRYGGSNVRFPGGPRVAIGSDGYVYAAVSFSGNDFTVPPLPLKGYEDAAILKVSSGGNITVIKSFWGNKTRSNPLGSTLRLIDIESAQKGGLHVAGNARGPLTNPRAKKSGGGGIYFSINSAGKVTKTKDYRSLYTKFDIAAGPVVSRSGKIYLGGRLSPPRNDGREEALITTSSGFNKKTDYFLYGRNSIVNLRGLMCGSQNSFAAIGDFWNSDLTSPMIQLKGSVDGFIVNK